MPTNTYVALDKVTISGSSTNSITFSSIPSTYTDLVIIVAGSAIGATAANVLLQLNSDTATNYSTTLVYGDGSSAGSARTTSASSMNIGDVDTGTSQAVNRINVMNYANTTTYKTIISRADRSVNSTAAKVGLWRSTSAITSITLFLSSSINITSGSTFSLYGIAAAPAATSKATGGYITEDSSYYYHLFTGTGTFTPSQSITADVLCIAAGGGGAALTGRGAGGAGGLLVHTSQSLTATNYTVTVSGGGAVDASGGNSQFGALTASVGGGYGGGSAAKGDAGGSGGSGGGSNYGASGGTATSGQGNAGGGSTSSSLYGGGGGGGSGASGGTGTTTNGGAGGVGTTSSFINSIGTLNGIGQLSSGNYYLAAGGGAGIFAGGTAGAGGIGGAGNGSANAAVGTDAIASTGSGGGGGSQSYNGGKGGSGVVVIRYAK